MRLKYHKRTDLPLKMFALFSFTLHSISGSKEKKVEDVTDQVPSSEEKMKMVLTAHDVRQRTVHKLRQHMGYRWGPKMDFDSKNDIKASG